MGAFNYQRFNIRFFTQNDVDQLLNYLDRLRESEREFTELKQLLEEDMKKLSDYIQKMNEKINRLCQKEKLKKLTEREVALKPKCFAKIEEAGKRLTQVSQNWGAVDDKLNLIKQSITNTLVLINTRSKSSSPTFLLMKGC